MGDEIDNSDLIEERNRLLGEVARLNVSRETGVPPGILANANNEDEARALATELLEWKAAGQAQQKPATAAVPAYNGVSQVPRSTLQYLTPEQIHQVWRQGRLEEIGAPVPPPRRNGEQHHNAAP